MTTQITDLERARAGDISRWRDKDGNEYTGPLKAYGDTLMFAGVTVRYPDGTVPSDCWLTFVSATREVDLPTEPLSVITDVTTTDGKYFSLGVRDSDPDGSRPWRLFERYSSYIKSFNADEIESFSLAKIVPADEVMLFDDAYDVILRTLHQDFCCSERDEDCDTAGESEEELAQDVLEALKHASNR